jgi:hypothetical protein
MKALLAIAAAAVLSAAAYVTSPATAAPLSGLEPRSSTPQVAPAADQVHYRHRRHYRSYGYYHPRYRSYGYYRPYYSAYDYPYGYYGGGVPLFSFSIGGFGHHHHHRHWR